MIRRLKNRFILIAMLSLSCVLIFIMSAVNIINYRSTISDADSVLEFLLINDGYFPIEFNDNRQFPKPNPPDKKFSAETPYETRFFSAELDSEGAVISTNTGNIAAVETVTAEKYALEVFESGNEKGFINIYRYCTKKIGNGNTLIVFIDCTRQLSTSRQFLFSSVAISAFGITAVFILLIIFSGRAIKPIAVSYEKQKRFITDSSHEIKTPLTVIAANTEVIELETGETEWTQSIKNQIKRLSALTKSLTALARMDEEGLKLEKAQFSLSEAITDSIEPFKVLAETTDKKLTFDIEAGINYYGNEQSLRQLIGILADNAFKYTENGGTIAFSLKKQHRNIRLSVFNTVTNIETGKHNNYFDRFYRADSSRSHDTGGFGIGLSIAKSIVETHGGRIVAESFDNQSIFITVTL